MEHFLSVVKQYVNFNGRARRQEFWMYYLFYIIFYVVLAIIDGVLALVFSRCCICSRSSYPLSVSPPADFTTPAAVVGGN